jgi:hypothetical protein
MSNINTNMEIFTDDSKFRLSALKFSKQLDPDPHSEAGPEDKVHPNASHIRLSKKELNI